MLYPSPGILSLCMCQCRCHGGDPRRGVRPCVAMPRPAEPCHPVLPLTWVGPIAVRDDFRSGAADNACAPVSIFEFLVVLARDSNDSELVAHNISSLFCPTTRRCTQSPLFIMTYQQFYIIATRGTRPSYLCAMPVGADAAF